MLIAPGMAETVAQEVHGAALPATAQDLRARGLQAGVRVADGELDADQAALDQSSEERGPERLGLGLADVDREDLPAAGLMDAVRDHQRLVDHAAAVADLLDLGIEEQVRIGALQRTRPERLHVLIERLTDAADLALGNPQPEALDQLVDAARGDPAHIGLLDDRQQRLLGPPARLQEAREVAAAAQLGDLQLDRPRPRLPLPRPITVAMRHPIIRTPLTELGADQLGHLALHQLAADRLHRRSDHIAMLAHHHLLDDLLDRHPVGTGHRWRLLSRRSPGKPDDHGRRGGRNRIRARNSRQTENQHATQSASTALRAHAPTDPSPRNRPERSVRPRPTPRYGT